MVATDLLKLVTATETSADELNLVTHRTNHSRPATTGMYPPVSKARDFCLLYDTAVKAVKNSIK